MKQLIFYFIFLNKRDSGGHSFGANLDDFFLFFLSLVAFSL